MNQPFRGRRRSVTHGRRSTWRAREPGNEKGEDVEGELEAIPWEYAVLIWDGDGRDDYRIVRFSHRQAWTPIAGNEYMQTLRELGDEGFELVTHQFLVRGKYDRGGRYGEQLRELMTFKRPLEE
jgi:hypothetical protein